MDIKKWLFLGLSVVVVVVLVIFFFRGGGGERIRVGAPTELLPETPPPTEEKPKETRLVTLFFPSEEDSFLHPEVREIESSPSLVEGAKQVVQELLKGSTKGYLSPFPAETKLRQFFVTREGLAYVDFSRELADRHPSGSSAELATVYSVVNSLAFNFKAIKKVFILVEGQERETLGGHINLSQAFLPMYSLNAQ